MKIILLLLLGLHCLSLSAQDFNVTAYGAKGDKTLCTTSIQQTIDAAAATGGGKVVVPPGEYVSGPLFLKSNIVFEIMPGAVIYFHNDITNTPTIMGSWEGIERRVYASLFTGHHLENVTITGRGRIDGQGATWWDAYLETDKIRVQHGIREREPENPQGSPLPYPRPRMINLYYCKNVQINEITITNSPSWTVHPVYCENVSIRAISIIQPYESPNTDGINPESCNGVRISDCYIDCGDDCITMKSGYNEHGRKKGIPCKNIAIMNCTFVHGRSAIGIGSEMSGGVSNVTIMNCVFSGTLRGIRVKTGRGRGGTVENLLANGIVMENIREGISIDMGYEGAIDKVMPVTEETPVFRNIRYSNIIGTNVEQAINIIGLPESMPEDIIMENIRIKGKRGLVCRYAKGLTLRNVELLRQDDKPAFEFYGSEKLQLNNLSAGLLQRSVPMIDLKNVKQVLIKDCFLPEGESGYFLRSSGSDAIEYLNNQLRHAKTSK